MNCYRFHVGLVTKDGFTVTEPMLNSARTVLERALGAWTEYRAEGRWNGQSEPTWVVEHWSPSLNARSAEMQDLASDLAVVLDQESVLLAELYGIVKEVSQ